jgi:hypothetical protein
VGVWLPLAVLGGAWCLESGRLAGLIRFTINRRSELSAIASLLFYPRALLSYDAASPLAGALAVAGAIAATTIRRPPVRFVLVFTTLGFAATMLHPFKSERFVATIVPGMWLLCAASAGLASRLPARARAVVLASVLIVLVTPLAGLYAHDLPALGRSITTHEAHPWRRFPWPGHELLDVQDLVVRSVDPAEPVYMAGEFNELAPTTLSLALRLRYPRTPVYPRCYTMPGSWPLPLNLVTLEVLPSSRYFDDDFRRYNAAGLEWIHRLESLHPSPFVDRTVDAAGVRVRVYRITQPL